MHAARFTVLLAASLAAGCANVDTGRDSGGEDRHPLGKADAVGSCLSEDGSDDFCGGRSNGNCWCDDQCEQFGDCCSDKPLACDGDVGLATTVINSEALFDAMAFSGEGSVVIGKSVKFVIDNRDPAEPTIHFLNANFDGAVGHPDAVRFHYFFAREVLPNVTETTSQFNNVSYFAQDKRYYAGTLQEYRLGVDAEPLYGIQFYPQDVIAEDSVLHMATVVADAVDIAGSRLAFVATGPQQTTATVSSHIDALGIEDLTLDEVLGSLNYLPMQLGEAWGFLRIFPENQDLLSAVDIPVFDELPLDLTVVAGTITKAVQDASSHINLKSKERGTPNMVLRNAGPDHEVLSRFADQPVHLVVGADGFTIEPSTEEEVRRKLDERLGDEWRELEIDRDAELASYDDMCPFDSSDCLHLADAYGGKAGGLGFLRHRDVLGTAADVGSHSAQLGYDAAPAGIGVPVQFYFDTVNHPDNTALKAKLDAFIVAEKDSALTVAQRVAALEDIRQSFMSATLPDGMVDDIRALVANVLPADTRSIKIRSSANAEDIPGFDGAGLYESHRANLDTLPNPDGSCTLEEEPGDVDVRPRTVDCQVKGVYASLWNKRAVEERSFARIDHATAGMGLAIVRRYKEKDDIAANSVVVTRVLNSSGVFGYTFSNQTLNNVVTNPDPGTESESIIAAFLPGVDPSFTVTRFAKPEPDQPSLAQTVMTDAQMRTMLSLTQAVERAYCEAKPEYYDGPCNQALFDADKPTALDMELKLYANGEFLCKQVREFAGK